MANVEAKYTVAADPVRAGGSPGTCVFVSGACSRITRSPIPDVNVTERITHKWDVVGRVSRQTLALPERHSGHRPPERIDHSWMAGAGVGYRVGETLRLGFDANYYRRTVDRTDRVRNYEGLRVGASISYGLPQ